MQRPPESATAIGWPSAIVLPEWASKLRWGMSLAEARAAGAAHAQASQPPIALLCMREPVLLQGVPLEATLLFELDMLARIELAGAIDGLAAAAMGLDERSLDDLQHHRLTSGDTRIAVDLLDGLIALEPEEAP